MPPGGTSSETGVEVASAILFIMLSSGSAFLCSELDTGSSRKRLGNIYADIYAVVGTRSGIVARGRVFSLPIGGDRYIAS